MAGDRQSGSGTPFDPSPQFWIYQIEGDQPPAVTGRCYFAPVRLGMTFDAVASKRSQAWTLDPCQLRVEEIQAYGHLLDELDEIMSARLILSGDLPPVLAPESVLVARNYPSDHWQRQGTIWLRQAQ